MLVRDHTYVLHVLVLFLLGGREGGREEGRERGREEGSK
jgi:hypothetical protein